MELKALKCPNCVALVDLIPGTNTAKCAYCGTQLYLDHHTNSQESQASPAPYNAPASKDTARMPSSVAQSSVVQSSVVQSKEAEKEWCKAIGFRPADYKSWWGIVVSFMAQYPRTVLSDRASVYDYAAYKRALDAYKQALAYAPPHICQRYEAAVAEHNRKARAAIQQNVSKAAGKSAQRQQAMAAQSESPRPRSVGLGILFSVAALWSLGLLELWPGASFLIFIGLVSCAVYCFFPKR